MLVWAINSGRETMAVSTALYGEEERRTEKTAQVLRTIDITWTLPCKITRSLGNSFTDLNVLLAFEAVGISSHNYMPFLVVLPVQENSAQTLLKVLLQTSNHFVQDVGRGATSLSAWLFVLQVFIENNIDGLSGGKWDELEILRDILPVVDKDCFDVVGYEELDSRLGVK